ncbi:type II toxin-antitoxin system HicA family toxin [Candidatus Parcubacteria bacterium]|nr:type II toxin-antitoxin system HicA family toxin [Candidatus Parcubacteria bacterium]
MPRLYSSRHIVSVLRENGFLFVSQRGSHMKFRRSGLPRLVVIVPARRREIPFGTFKSILRQSQLQLEDFVKR